MKLVSCCFVMENKGWEQYTYFTDRQLISFNIIISSVEIALTANA